MNIKPIETVYKGYRFRSRLEARWAVYFSNVHSKGRGWKWVYEKEGFNLGNGVRYLPDFWLPSLKMWAEIKPTKFSKDEMMKCAQLASGTGFMCAMVVGVPGEFSAKDQLVFDPTGTNGGFVALEGTSLFSLPVGIEAARAARFEHGEQPA